MEDDLQAAEQQTLVNKNLKTKMTEAKEQPVTERSTELTYRFDAITPRQRSAR